MDDLDEKFLLLATNNPIHMPKKNLFDENLLKNLPPHKINQPRYMFHL